MTLSGKPFQGPMCTYVEDHIGFEIVLQPSVEHQILMGAGYHRIMIHSFHLVRPASEGLEADVDVTVDDPGDDHLTVIDGHISGGFAPALLHPSPVEFG